MVAVPADTQIFALSGCLIVAAFSLRSDKSQVIVDGFERIRFICVEAKEDETTFDFNDCLVLVHFGDVGDATGHVLCK